MHGKDKTGGAFGPNFLSKDLLKGKKWKLDKGHVQECQIKFLTFELRDVTDIKERKKKLKDSFDYDVLNGKPVEFFTIEIKKTSEWQQVFIKKFFCSECDNR